VPRFKGIYVRLRSDPRPSKISQKLRGLPASLAVYLDWLASANRVQILTVPQEGWPVLTILLTLNNFTNIMISGKAKSAVDE
jgi:hypothetical protein